VTKDNTPFDYWGLFKISVKQLSIAPSEAWGLDLVEVIQLTDQQNKESVDTSIMLNYKRHLNGASKKWLQSKG